MVSEIDLKHYTAARFWIQAIALSVPNGLAL